MRPSTVRALCVARRPHQHSDSTCRTSTRSASSMRRADPGNRRVRKSAVMPNAKTSISVSSTRRASCLDLRRGVELRLVAHEVVHGLRLGGDERPEVGVVVDLARDDLETEARGEPVGPGAVVAREDQPAPAPRGMVVVELERQGGLAAVHGPGEEDELCHRRSSARSVGAVAPVAPGRRGAVGSGGRDEQRHAHLALGERAVHAQERERRGRLGARVDDGRPPAARP